MGLLTGWRLGALGALLFMSCESTTVRLYVDLRTDFVPGIDYVGTEVRFLGREVDLQSRLAFREDIAAPYRIASFGGLEQGPAQLEVSLIGGDGDIVFRRGLVVSLSADLGVTVTASRLCAEVECAPNLACYAGACVSQECTEENPAAARARRAKTVPSRARTTTNARAQRGSRGPPTSPSTAPAVFISPTSGTTAFAATPAAW